MQDLKIYNDSFLIIGAPNTKKSVVSRILSKRLGYKLINLDREKHSFFDDFTDFDFNKYQDMIEKYGYNKGLNYIHSYEMKHLDYVLDKIDCNVVIDFGNTYILIDNLDILNKIKLFKNIILLESDNVSLDNKKFVNNKLLKKISTININIDSLDEDMIVDKIINSKDIKDIL